MAPPCSVHFDPTAKPQTIPAGEVHQSPLEVWPEKWGITTTQFARLLEECRKDENWDDSYTVGDLVFKYVIPLTRGTGLSYAVLVNSDAPKEVDVMISHAWAENALDFLQTLERSVDDHEVLFICALSLYQCGDGAGPTIAEQLGTSPEESPFHRVLQKIHDRGEKVQKHGGWWRQRAFIQRLPWMVLVVSLTLLVVPVIFQGCIPMHASCAHGECKPLYAWLPIHVWKWEFRPLEGSMRAVVVAAHVLAVVAVALFIAAECFRRSGYMFKGRMVAVPNHECEMYTRLWCVFEMFVAQKLNVPVKLANTLASAGKVNSANAQCTNEDDARKIHAQIKDYHGEPDASPSSFFGLPGAEEEEEEEKEAGYRMLDDAIREVSNKAWSRAYVIEVMMAFPLALCLVCTVRMIKKGSVHWWQKQAGEHDPSWYDRVIFLASHGRLGYDLFCWEVFEASPKALWSWCLVLGTVLGYWINLSSIVHTAKKARGRLTYCSIAKVAIGLIFVEVIVNLMLLFGEQFFGLCKRRPYRFNWFVLGLTAALAQGSLILLLLLFVVAMRQRLLGRQSLRGKGAEIVAKAILAACGLGVFIFMMFSTSRVHRPESFFPSIVMNGFLIFGWMLGPLAILWTNAVRFGVEVIPARDRGCLKPSTFQYSEVSRDSSEGSAEAGSSDE